MKVEGEIEMVIDMTPHEQRFGNQQRERVIASDWEETPSESLGPGSADSVGIEAMI